MRERKKNVRDFFRIFFSSKKKNQKKQKKKKKKNSYQLRVDRGGVPLERPRGSARRGLGAGHQQVLDQGAVRPGLRRRGDDVGEPRAVAGLGIGRDRRRGVARGEVRVAELGPDRRVVDRGGVGVGLGQRGRGGDGWRGGRRSGGLSTSAAVAPCLVAGFPVLEQHLDRLRLEAKLFVDLKRLVKHLVAHRDLPDRGPVKVVEPRDVVRDARLVRLDGGDNEQVLQVVVARERRVGHQDDLLEQLDQLRLQPGGHERLDRHGDLLRVAALGQRGRNHLVDQRPSTLGPFGQHFGPQLGVGALDDVARLRLEERVRRRAAHELVVALAAAVGDAREVRVALLAVFPDGARVVVGVGREEVLGVGPRGRGRRGGRGASCGGAAAVDEDLPQCRVHPGVLGPLGHQLLQKRSQQPEPVALLDLLAQRVDGHERPHGEDEVGDELVGRVGVEEAADDGRGRRGVDLLDVGLDVARGARGPEVGCGLGVGGMKSGRETAGKKCEFFFMSKTSLSVSRALTKKKKKKKKKEIKGKERKGKERKTPLFSSLSSSSLPVRSPTIPCLSHTLISGLASGSFASIRNCLVRSGG